MPLFTLSGANIGYNGVAVLQDIHLKIEPGERVALVGQSGAGKSTLLNTLYRQQSAVASLVVQDYALVNSLSVFHNIYMGRLDRHSSVYNLINLVHPLKQELRAIAPLLESLGLGEKRDTPVGELSGGQKQRTAVARAFFQGGEVLLADEPVSSVDPLQARNVLKAIVESYPTVVLALHDVDLALEFMDRVIGLKSGRILLDRPADGMTPADLDGLYQTS